MIDFGQTTFVQDRVDRGADQRGVAVRAEALLPLLSGDRPR